MQTVILPPAQKSSRIARSVKPYVGVRLAQPQPSPKIVPESYMTGKEFWEKVEKGVDEICQKHGVL